MTTNPDPIDLGYIEAETIIAETPVDNLSPAQKETAKKLQEEIDTLKSYLETLASKKKSALRVLAVKEKELKENGGAPKANTAAKKAKPAVTAEDETWGSKLYNIIAPVLIALTTFVVGGLIISIVPFIGPYSWLISFIIAVIVFLAILNRKETFSVPIVLLAIASGAAAFGIATWIMTYTPTAWQWIWPITTLIGFIVFAVITATKAKE